MRVSRINHFEFGVFLTSILLENYAQAVGPRLHPYCNLYYDIDNTYDANFYRRFARIISRIELHTDLRFVRWRWNTPYGHVLLTKRPFSAVNEVEGYRDHAYKFDICRYGCSEWDTFYYILLIAGLIRETHRYDKYNYVLIFPEDFSHEGCHFLQENRTMPKFYPFSYESVLYGDYFCCQKGKECVYKTNYKLKRRYRGDPQGQPTDVAYDVDLSRLRILYPRNECMQYNFPPV